jgi:hypothetical protein
MSYEEEDTCIKSMSDPVCVCVCVCVCLKPATIVCCMSYDEEDTCMSYEEEDTCMSYDVCMCV